MKDYNLILLFILISISNYNCTRFIKEKTHNIQEETNIISDDHYSCLRTEIIDYELKDCLNKLNVNNYIEAKDLVNSLIVKDLDQIILKTHKKTIDSKIINYLNDLEGVFKQNDIDYKEYNNLLIDYGRKIKTNKFILNGLNEIRKYLNKIIIIKGLFTKQNIKDFDDIKKSFKYGLKNAQLDNENTVTTEKMKLESNIADHMDLFDAKKREENKLYKNNDSKYKIKFRLNSINLDNNPHYHEDHFHHTIKKNKVKIYSKIKKSYSLTKNNFHLD